MANKFTRISNFGAETHFSQAVTGELVYSRMVSPPSHLTTFNAGDIVPIGCFEVLPHDTYEMSLDFVIRQNTVLTPTMGTMNVDFYAFFVPNRVVNQSWKTVQGENPNGSWTAPQVTLAPLLDLSKATSGLSTVKINVGTVADYYGFPTQQPMPVQVLTACHDLKFRGYVEIYNEFFRDQNYQPPIPYSKLNVYNDFLYQAPSTGYSLTEAGSELQDDSYGSGSVNQAVFGNLDIRVAPNAAVNYHSGFNANGAPLRANKLHDYFTSGTPSPMKGPDVLIPVGGQAPVLTSASRLVTGIQSPLGLAVAGSGAQPVSQYVLNYGLPEAGVLGGVQPLESSGNPVDFYPTNLYADLSQASAATLSDLRMAAAIQQVYETLAMGGSRYREVVRILFGLEVDNPYEDIPTLLGHFRRELDLFQTAQTGASQAGNTPQGNLAAFGYTANSGYLFKRTFLEHGYVHIFAVVRHKNVYSSFLARDNFRRNMLDWYMPPLANISQQPIYTREINPFAPNPDQVFTYQEAWAEYRYDPDYVSGYMRPGVSNTLAFWNYADTFDRNIVISTGEWLKSNSREVLDRTLAVTSSVAHQLKGQFRFKIDKERPMPTYSIPGLDIF